MTLDENQYNDLIERLDKIHDLLQNLFIMEATRSGATRDEVREFLHVAATTVGDVRKLVKTNRDE